MRLAELRVRNYRCLDALDLRLDPLTAIIGANGTGKSSVIRALEFLFGQASGTQADVTSGSDDLEFEVAAVLDGLDDDQRQYFAPWTGDEGTLAVGRRWTADRDETGAVTGTSTSWFASRRAVAAFVPVRTAASAGEAKDRYTAVRADPRYEDLPPYKNRPGAEQALNDWESSHPEADRESVEDSTLRFDGSGSPHDLRRHLDLLVVPAVRDPAVDADEAKGSNLARLTDLVLRSRVDLADQLEGLRTRTAEEHQQIVAAGAGQALTDLQDTVSAQLSALAPGTEVRLDWRINPPTISAPTVRASIAESGYVAEVGRQGHGVQRAYVFALLRALVDARDSTDPGDSGDAGDPGDPGDGDAPAPPAAPARASLMVVVEEPELYQHPVRSQYLSRTLADLARDGSSQVLYATHSPYFAGVERLDAIRLFRMKVRPDGVSVTTYSAFDARDAADRLNAAADGHGTPWTPARLRTQLASLLETPVGEGLFARAVVLVEGQEDRGALRGTDDHNGTDLAADGIAVVPVDGKDNLERAYVLYKQLALPVYVLFDSDNDRGNAQDKQRNQRLTRLLAGHPNDAPATQVNPTWACADPNLLTVVGNESGTAALEAALAAAADDLGLDPDRGRKNGVVVRNATAALAANSSASPTLQGLLIAARALAP
jgi:putative ATP-dependent endonuclease of OLD family